MRSILILSAAVVALSGCFGPGAVRGLAPDAGTEIRYAAPPETVLAALPTVFKAQGFSMEPSARFDSATMLVGIKDVSFISYGGFVRVLVREGEVSGQTYARFVALRRSVLDFSGYTGRYVPRVIAALDDSLGVGALGPFPGMRVRGQRPDSPGPLILGMVDTSSRGELVVVPHEGRPVPLRSLQEVATLRGAYGHGLDGALVGWAAGMVVGAVIGAASEDQYPVMAGMFGVVLGGAIGEIAGFVVGASVRTEVWSAVDPARP